MLQFKSFQVSIEGASRDISGIYIAGKGIIGGMIGRRFYIKKEMI